MGKAKGDSTPTTNAQRERERNSDVQMANQQSNGMKKKRESFSTSASKHGVGRALKSKNERTNRGDDHTPKYPLPSSHSCFARKRTTHQPPSELGAGRGRCGQ